MKIISHLITLVICIISINAFAASSNAEKEAESLIENKQYQEAFNLLNKQIDLKDFTSQKMFLLGFAAREVGQYDTSTKMFNYILKTQPKSYRVRFELALTYLKNARFAEAKEQLLLVKDANPPKDVALAIDKVLAQLDVKTKSPKVFYGNISVGQSYDSNVNYGSAISDVLIGENLLANTKPNKGWAQSYSAMLGYNKNFNNSSFGVAGMAYGSLVDYVNLKNNPNDLMTFSTVNGINFYTKNTKLYVPVAYSSVWIDSGEFGRSAYIDIYGVTPSLTVAIGDKFYTSTTASVLQKTFRDESLSNRNSTLTSLTNSFNYELSKSTLVSFTPGIIGENATLKAYSNAGYNGSFAIYQGFYDDKLIANLSLSKSFAKYDALDPQFAIIRSDHNASINSGLTYNCSKEMKLLLTYAYTKNDSNVTAFTYRKHQTSLALSYGF